MAKHFGPATTNERGSSRTFRAVDEVRAELTTVG